MIWEPYLLPDLTVQLTVWLLMATQRLAKGALPGAPVVAPCSATAKRQARPSASRRRCFLYSLAIFDPGL